MNRESVAAHPFVTGPSMVLHRRRLLVLAYHGVDDPESFRRQLEWLLRFRVAVTLADVESSVRHRRVMPANSFLVTFDDGRRSVLERGVPVLESLDVPAALFVVAGLVGTSEPFWWDEAEALSASGGRTSVTIATGSRLVSSLKGVTDVQRRRALDELRASSSGAGSTYPHLSPNELVELERRGVAIGSHSLTHPCLDKCTPEESVAELRESRERLERWVGHEVRSVAYPNGDADESVEAAAAEAGYHVGFLFDHRLGRNPPSNPLGISRVRVDATESLERFQTVVSGVGPFVLGLRRRR